MQHQVSKKKITKNFELSTDVHGWRILKLPSGNRNFTNILNTIGFTFTESIPLPSSLPRRDVRIVAGNSESWVYQACVADSIGTGKIYTLYIYSNTSSVVEGTAPNDGINNFDMTVIQGLSDCAYAGLVVRKSSYNILAQFS